LSPVALSPHKRNRSPFWVAAFCAGDGRCLNKTRKRRAAPLRRLSLWKGSSRPGLGAPEPVRESRACEGAPHHFHSAKVWLHERVSWEAGCEHGEDVFEVLADSRRVYQPRERARQRASRRNFPAGTPLVSLFPRTDQVSCRFSPPVARGRPAPWNSHRVARYLPGNRRSKREGVPREPNRESLRVPRRAIARMTPLAEFGMPSSEASATPSETTP
jgi:hypothetical protein